MGSSLYDRVARLPKSGPSLSQDNEGPKWLEANGFGIVSVANNHIMDYGEGAMEYTKSSFSSSLVFGAGSWTEAYSPCIIDKDGAKAAIFGLAHYEFGMLADKWAARCQKGVAWINHPDVDKIILQYRKEVDYLIVLAHAGVEHIEQPLPEWRDRYRLLIDLGCDAVIASHPHISQGWEIYKDKPIIYSLGNFYFPKPMEKPKQWYKSLCATLDLQGSKVHLSVTPVVFGEKKVSIDNSKETEATLAKINAVLSDESRYMEYINTVCLEKLGNYDNSLERSGYIKFGRWMKMLKYSVKYLLGKDNNFNSVHLENLFRCESHRWCVTRGIKIRDNFQY